MTLCFAPTAGEPSSYYKTRPYKFQWTTYINWLYCTLFVPVAPHSARGPHQKKFGFFCSRMFLVHLNAIQSTKWWRWNFETTKPSLSQARQVIISVLTFLDLIPWRRNSFSHEDRGTFADFILSNVSFWSGVPDARGKPGENFAIHEVPTACSQVDADQFFAVSPM